MVMGATMKEWLTYWDSLDESVRVILLMLYAAVMWELIGIWFNAMERKQNARKRNGKQ